jgi:hypothetical protein
LSLWHETTVLHLTENKQLEGSTAEDHQFAEWLLKVGRGQNNDDAGLLELPTSMRCGEQIEHLIKSMYPAINQLNPHRNNDEFFSTIQFSLPAMMMLMLSMHKSYTKYKETFTLSKA